MIVSSRDISFSAPKGFIVIEGVNGAGKGTVIQAVCEQLRARGMEPLLTREPGGSPLGPKIRPMLLEHGGAAPTPRAEMFLFAADRAEHVERVIRPAIERKQIVICDRYFYSSIAFQGHGRGLPVDQVTEINHIAVDGELPDAVILLDLDPAIGLERTSRRGAADGADAFEAETLAFHERIRSGFQKMAKEREESFVVIDAAQSASAVFNEAWEVFEKLLTARAHA